MNKIQRRKIMKSKRRRKKPAIKKNRPFEVRSQSVETATEQRKKRRISDDIVLEILSWLPVKSLLRFMCVSKNWKTLITSHPFRKMHREKHTSSPPLSIACYNTFELCLEGKILKKTYLLTFDRERRFVEEITVPIPSGYFITPAPPYQSKLLCFLSYELMKFYLYNPSTRQSFLLTNPSSFSSPNLDLPSSAYGYIPSKDEYIMVHLVKLSNGNLVCEVLNNIFISDDNFKLHYNQWRSSTEVTMMLDSVTGPVVFVGGAFYWQAFTTTPKNLTDDFILSFDVEADSFSTINYPPGVLRLRSDARLLDIKNDLYLAVYPESPAILVMWKWSSGNKLWSQDWKFDFEKLFGLKRAAHQEPFFSYEVFIYTVKYLKGGYEEQPPDDQVSAEMGVLHLPDEVTEVAVHTNLFTL